jgi:hypothetical protein
MDRSVQFIDRIRGDSAAAAQILGLEFLNGIIDKGQVREDQLRHRDPRQIGLEALPGQNPQQFTAEPADMAFNLQRLRGDSDRLEWRACSMSLSRPSMYLQVA